VESISTRHITTAITIRRLWVQLAKRTDHTLQNSNIVKGQSNEIFDSRFFTKRIILVSIDMRKSDFKICQILVEFFVLKLSKNRLPAVNDRRGVKNKALGNPYFWLFWNALGEQYSTWIVHFLLHCLFKGRGSPSNFLKNNSLLSTVTLRYKWGRE
jgi:hypothetical protein